MDIAMIASLMRPITGIPSSVSGRFRGAGKWFRHAYGLPGPDVARVAIKGCSEVCRGSRSQSANGLAAPAQNSIISHPRMWAVSKMLLGQKPEQHRPRDGGCGNHVDQVL